MNDSVLCAVHNGKIKIGARDLQIYGPSVQVFWIGDKSLLPIGLIPLP